MEKYNTLIYEKNKAVEKFNSELSQKENHVSLLNEKDLSNKSTLYTKWDNKNLIKKCLQI